MDPSIVHSGLSRRDFLRRTGQISLGAAVLGGMAPLVTACGASTKSTGNASGSGKSSGKVVVADWGGDIQDAEKKYLYDPFTKETGIEVVLSGPPDDAKIKAMVDSGNVEWDVVAGAVSDVLALGTKYFEPLPDSVKTADGVDPKYITDYSAGYYVFSTNLGWNTKATNGKPLNTWADFWNTGSYPGKRTLAFGGGNDPQLEFALLADGVPMESLYPLDIDRAFTMLKDIKPSIAQWWSSGSQPGQMLSSGQVAAASIWVGRAQDLKKAGAPVDFTFNQGMIIPAAWIVPKGAPNKDNAFKLIEYSLRPEIQGAVWGNYSEGPTNSKAFDKMSQEWAKTLPTYPDNAKVQFVRDEQWWGKNRTDVLQRFQALSL